MLSSTDLERLITEKRREIELEKTLLGLTPPADNDTAEDNKIVTFPSARGAENVASDHPEPATTHEDTPDTPGTPVDGELPPDLERYIRRYLGLPVMLRAGEYSPNNPLARAERTPGDARDALRGLGEYERRRHTLRRAQQRQYREYLDQQAKKKQEAKEQAERERREREEKERLEEERQRQREEVERERRLELERDRRVVLEQDRRALEQDRRVELERERRVVLERDRSPEIRRASYTYTGPTNFSYVTKVDTGVQVDAGSAPLSVAVQTDDLYTPNRQLCNLLTEAERELSPHTAEPRAEPWPPWRERRRSCGDFDKPAGGAGAACREARTVPRYQPSILDGDAVELRNQLAEKEALERRRWYERELRHQIQEQQRLRHQRTARERLLEQAETRRLEEQLRGLRVAHERERQRQRAATQQMKDHASEYETKRNKLQQEIEAEGRLLKLKQTDIQDTERPYQERRPYSMNLPEDTIFNHNYDVESYLRRNLNPTKESLISNAFETDDKLKSLIGEKIAREYNDESINRKEDPQNYYKGNEVNELPKKPRPQETRINDDTLPIPVLRHSPKRVVNTEPDAQLSEAMQIVDGKWRVPVVQKNILKSIPNDGGKPVSILTQLGSIRRQLQMEQLKLDKMLSKNNQA